MSSLAPFDIDVVPESAELLEIARKELRETPEVREEALRELRKLLHDAEDLCYSDDEDFLIIFLRVCHFYPESAIQLMRRIANFRKEYVKLVGNLMPDDEKEAFTETPTVNILKNKDQKGRRVLVVQCGSLWDPKKVNSDQLFRLFYLIHLVAMLEPSSQVNGVVMIMDYQGLSMKQVNALSISFAKLLLTFIQDAIPLRIKEIHFVHQPFLFKMVWAFFKTFVREKLKERIFFHGSTLTGLHKYIDRDYLPKNYDGTMPEIDYSGKDWFPCVENYKQQIQNWHKYGFKQ